MAGITTIEPSLRIPDVPSMPRASGFERIAEGIGDLAQGAATFIERARADQVGKAKSEATTRIRQAAADADQDDDTDFDAVTDRFRQKSKEAREQLRPAELGPEDAQDFDDDMAAYEEAQARRVREDAFKRAKPGVKGRLVADIDGFARDAGNAGDDQDAIDAVSRVAGRHLDRHVKAGWITEVEGKKLVRRYRAKAQRERLRKLADFNPDAARAAIEDGAAEDMDPGERDQLVADIDDGQRLREASDEAELRKGLEDLQTQLNDEALPDDERMRQLQDMAQVSGDPNAVTAAQAGATGLAFARRLGRMPPDDAAALWQKVAENGNPTPERDAALAFGRGMLKQMERRLGTDPIAFAQDQGLIDPAPIDFQTATPEDLATRAKTARMVAQYYRLGSPIFLTGNESQNLGQAFKAADPARKQQVMTGVIAAFGAADASTMFRQLGHVAQAEAHLAALAAWGNGRDEVAARGFVGQAAIDAKAVTLPDEQVFAETEQETIGNLFDARLSQSRASIIAGARALYAERAINKGIVGYDAQEYEKALQQASGLSAQGGGIGARNGRKLLLPMDLNQAALDGTIMGLDGNDLVAIATGKNAPAHVTLSGQIIKATPQDVQKGVLVQSGYGRYRVSMTDPANGPAQYLVDEKTGKYYEIDLGDAAKRPAPATLKVEGSFRGVVSREWVKGEKAKPSKDQSRLQQQQAPQSRKDQSRIAPEEELSGGEGSNELRGAGADSFGEPSKNVEDKRNDTSATDRLDRIAKALTDRDFEYLDKEPMFSKENVGGFVEEFNMLEDYMFQKYGRAGAAKWDKMMDGFADYIDKDDAPSFKRLADGKGAVDTKGWDGDKWRAYREWLSRHYPENKASEIWKRTFNGNPRDLVEEEDDEDEAEPLGY